MSLLSCPLCLKPHFHGVDALRSSLINVATAHIACPVCDELLLGLDKFTIHLFSHIPSNKIIQHNSNGSSVNAIAEEPGSQTSNEVLIKDIEMHHEAEEPTTETNKETYISCDICNFHFTDENILDLHQKLLHQTCLDIKTGKYNYHCHLCSKQFRMRGSLMVHLRVAHFGFIQNNYKSTTRCGDQNSGCSNENTSSTSKIGNEKHQNAVDKRASPKSQENKQWECDVCFKLFTTKYFLKKHKRLHTGEMPYYCMQCNKYFTFQQSYHKHMLYHSDDKPHVCSECGRAFKELSTLHNHERIHSGERPFSCETCGKCFRQRVSYLVHRRIHTGVMPYRCTACNKSFRYKVSQRSHKCPVSPPGCVIRTPDLMEKLMQNRSDEHLQRVSSQGLNQSNLESPPIGNFNYLDRNLSNITNKSFIENCSATEMITQCATNSDVCDKRESNNCPPANENPQKKDSTVGYNTSDTPNPDFFTLILSPVLSDVQSLCLSNYSSVQDASPKRDSADKNDVLQTINEESFKELLYGPTNS